MSQRWARSFQCPLWAATCACWLVIIPLAEAGDLPPPPSGMEAVADAQLFLELVVNQMNTGRVVAVDQRGGRFFLPATALRDNKLQMHRECRLGTLTAL